MIFLVACSSTQNQVTVSSFGTATQTDMPDFIRTPRATITPTPDVLETRRAELKETQSAETTGTEAVNSTARNEYQATKFSRLSQTPKPSWTSTPTGTGTPTITPTFSSANALQTYTPAPSAVCPESLGGNTPVPEFFEYGLFSWPGEPEEMVLDYLNIYGPKPILDAHARAVAQGKNLEPIYFQDLTNDDVPELVMVAKVFFVFGCRDGKYQTLYRQTDVDGYLSAYYVTHLLDGNRNGVPEITMITGWLSQGGHFYRIIEWNNGQFFSLLEADSSDYPESGEIFVEATGDVSFADIDDDWIKEMVVYRGIPVWETYTMSIPWRHETKYYKWNGRHYAFYRLEYDEPQYRFQAVQDGDRFAYLHEYDKALVMYQSAIFDNELEWWSPERQAQLEYEWIHRFGSDPSAPTITPPTPDNDEYYYLAAYSRYRIMVLHILRGWIEEAQTVYDTLQEKFPEGQVGHPFAEMATAFWNEYQVSENIEQACSRSIAYAAAHPEILTYLGDTQHGLFHSIWYQPEYVCPFK